MGDVVDNNCTVGVSVVHRRQRFISFLPSGIPYLELHSCALVKGDGLGEERGTDGRFPIIIELILGVYMLATGPGVITRFRTGMDILSQTATPVSSVRQPVSMSFHEASVDKYEEVYLTFPTADSPISKKDALVLSSIAPGLSSSR